MNENCAEVSAGKARQGRHYKLICSGCGTRYSDDGLILDCPADHPPALLRTDYSASSFSPSPNRDDLFRYREWLPVTAIRGAAPRPRVYRSRGLAGALALPNLWIAFNGYWPEGGACFETSTFKDLEAYTVLNRLPEEHVVLTVASSGNTGAAFAWACSQEQKPCLLMVPEKGLRRLRFRASTDPCVKLVSIVDGDYPDAIRLASSVSRLPFLYAEGGVKNVGRRDGLGTVLLSAFEEMNRLPSHYFQAVGSGTGAIGVLEAAKRIANGTDGAFSLPRLMLCQNLPFTPIYDAWRMNLTALSDTVEQRYRAAIEEVHADELTNFTPPYAIRGGVYDSLVESGGDVLVADNTAVRAALEMFLEVEGIDIEPAAGVAVACLRAAVREGRVPPESAVLLNVTGGGRHRLAREHDLVPAEPQLRVSRSSITSGRAVHQVAELCSALV